MLHCCTVDLSFWIFLVGGRPAGMSDAHLDWLTNLGHDTYSYPSWITSQQRECACNVASISPRKVVCKDSRKLVDWRSVAKLTPGAHLTYCIGRAWLLEHMPEFDLHYLPGSVTVNSTSMLDDVVAFALMADRAAPWTSGIPLAVRLAYGLPYGGYHESRQNWRPLFFAKFFPLVANATSTEEALGRLVAPDEFLRWSKHYWPSSPKQRDPAAPNAYTIEWSSSTAPPVVSPLEFVAYGYGSCSAWATFLTYVARAVGLPARQVGTPCWNSVFEGVDFRGRAAHNPNVSTCWRGGTRDAGHGGRFLNNHNWVEIYRPAVERGLGVNGDFASWAFVNVPPASKSPNDGLCGPVDRFDVHRGCGYDAEAPKGQECAKVDAGPGAAMQDHEIFALTWSLLEDQEDGGPDLLQDDVGKLAGWMPFQGGPVLDPAGKTISDGRTPITPLVWSPALASPMGTPLRNVGIRLVNRTDFYRCKPTPAKAHEPAATHGQDGVVG